MAMNSMLMRAPVAADFTDALADLLRDDPGLAQALVIKEAWTIGYVDRLLSSAEVLGAQFAELSYVGASGMSPTTFDRASAAVRRAVAQLNPKLALHDCISTPTDEEVEVLTDMVRAYARFQRLTTHLERRSHRRFATFAG
jgi:hypothetical protein